MPQKERCKLHTGTKIKELRKERNMTQEELGELLGVKKAAIQKYEKGEIINLKLATIKKLCDIFQVSPDKLIFPDGEMLDQKYNSKELKFEVKVIEEIEALYGLEAINMIVPFTKLNEKGKERAIDLVEDMAQLEKYTVESSR